MASASFSEWHVAAKENLPVNSQKGHIASLLTDRKVIPEIPRRSLYQSPRWLEVLLSKLTDDHYEALYKSQAFKLLPLLSTRMDWPLIGALVERWNPVTHTFHFRFGETTVLLEEVPAILGVRSPLHRTCGPNGRVTLLSISPGVEEILNNLFDGTPLKFMHKGRIRLEAIAMGCLGRNYHLDPLKKQKFLTCVFMCLMGVTLFFTEDMTLDAPHAALLLAWHSLQFSSLAHPILAFLYRGLTSAATGGEFFGSPYLLQTWAYIHFTFSSNIFAFPPSHNLSCGAVLLAGYDRRDVKRDDWRCLFEWYSYEMFDIIPTWIFPNDPYVPLVPECDLLLVDSGHFVVYLPHRCVGWIQGSIFPSELSHIPRIEERALGMPHDLHKIKDIIKFYELLIVFAKAKSKNKKENERLSAWYPRVRSIATGTAEFPDFSKAELIYPRPLKNNCHSSLVPRAYEEAEQAHSSSFGYSRNFQKQKVRDEESSLSPSF